jgi:hypothetical protein
METFRVFPTPDKIQNVQRHCDLYSELWPICTVETADNTAMTPGFELQLVPRMYRVLVYGIFQCICGYRVH